MQYEGEKADLPADHWIHKAMAKEKSRHAKKSAKPLAGKKDGAPAGAKEKPGSAGTVFSAPAKKPAMGPGMAALAGGAGAPDDGDHDYR